MLLKGGISSLYQTITYQVLSMRSFQRIQAVVLFLDPLPSALILGPRPSAPISLVPPKYCKNKFMSKAYYLFKIILIQN